MKKQEVRIVQPMPGNGVTLTRGTKVMVGDVEIAGVYKIVLRAEVDDVWRAEIHCFPSYIEMTALADVSVKHATPILMNLRRMWQQLRGIV